MLRAAVSMFAQIVQFLLQSLVFRLVQKYQIDKASKGISTKDQLIAMMFCQLCGAESPKRNSRRIVFKVRQSQRSRCPCYWSLESVLRQSTS